MLSDRVTPPISGCNSCRRIYQDVMGARREMTAARGVLQRVRDDTVERYAEEARAAKDGLRVAQDNYDAHHAAEHPEGAPQAAASTNAASRYWSSKPALPTPGTLAEMVRNGETVEVLAERYQRTPEHVAHHLTSAGFHGVTGEPRVHQYANDGLPTLHRLFQYPAWFDEALCAQTDPDAFFPDKGGSTRQAKAVCAACPVRAECLEYALENRERFGIFGGLSERERRGLEKAS